MGVPPGFRGPAHGLFSVPFVPFVSFVVKIVPMRRLTSATLGLVLAAVALIAAESPAWQTAPRLVALVGGTLIDGFGGPPLRNSVVLVQGERITAVGQVGALAIPSGTDVISTEGMTVLPGLWDMHVHLMINGHSDYTHWDKTYPTRFEKDIMPASALQLLKAGVTSARDLGGPLEASLNVRDAINRGTIPGPTMYVSGPFIQHEPYPGTELFRWGVKGPEEARTKVRQLAKAGVDVIKLIDQDQMTEAEIAAVINEAHANGLPVVGHSHRPDEIRLGLKYGVDNFEHTGLATAPEYPADIIEKIRERTAKMALGPFFWTPTVQGLFNYDYMRDNPEMLDDPSWTEGLPPDIVADIRKSIQHPDRMPYFQLTPARKPTLEAKDHAAARGRRRRCSSGRTAASRCSSTARRPGTSWTSGCARWASRRWRRSAAPPTGRR